jgi:hypothetical protein
MWPFIKPIKLIRYLLVWRANSSLVRLPRCLSTEISLLLGTAIANRLPTRQAHIETVLFVYPGKLTFGQGELILWELELMGESADHGLFLEVILPAIEELGSVPDPQWRNWNVLWGHFDIQAVYAARGLQWEPVVSDGRLDLNYRVTPTQWAEGLTFDAGSERIFDRLTWITPFDLTSKSSRRRRKKIAPHQVPTLQRILESLVVRMSQLLPGKHHTPDDVWAVLSAEERASFQAAMEQAARIPVHHTKLKPAPKHWPGRWIGTQTFPSIPHPIIPYLELASILHIGRQTHFGCGTFVIG